jgi:hypothetical protein
MRQNRADILRERYGKLQKQNEINVSGPLYIYENHKKHDFSLPKKSICGQQLIGPGRRFKGDSYFMMFVKTGDLRIHEVLESAPPTEKLNEASEGNMEKLILDQPEKFTSKGQTEHVLENNPQVQPMNEITKDNAKQPAGDVLLVENPMAGIDIIS